MSLDLCNSCQRFPEGRCGVTIKFLPWAPAPKTKHQACAVEQRPAVRSAAPSLLRVPLVPTVTVSRVVEKPRTVQREPEVEESAIVFKSAARSLGCCDFIRA